MLKRHTSHDAPRFMRSQRNTFGPSAACDAILSFFALSCNIHVSSITIVGIVSATP